MKAAPYRVDAVFSVLFSIGTLEDALKNAARNVAATIKVGQGL